MSADYTARHSPMAVYLVGGGTQYRAYCEPCALGLNWWADDEGRVHAEGYAEFHRCTASAR